jgi:hypothetical protein
MPSSTGEPGEPGSELPAAMPSSVSILRRAGAGLHTSRRAWPKFETIDVANCEQECKANGPLCTGVACNH